jgi:DNA phosphorothioation-associated DGQHR protein 1
MNNDVFYETQALRVEQRLATFYVVVLPAELLLKVAGSAEVRAILKSDGTGYELEGTQRFIKDKRLEDIAEYIERVDSTFPNAIILAANHNHEYGLDQRELDDMENEKRAEKKQKLNDSSLAWSVTEAKDGTYTMTIPTEEKLAAIIDGQHRLFAFAEADFDSIKDINLLCSVFMDIPIPLQAQIFATINSTQKRVDRSLTYELFGYNVSDEDEEYWTPDKLAIFLSRRLGTVDESPFKGRIRVAPKNDKALENLADDKGWRISTATVVDGIVRLISSNPMQDANAMRKDTTFTRKILKTVRKTDPSPLRAIFIAGEDIVIYTMVLNYLKACEEIFWADPDEDSFIIRTVGVQAVFDVLRKIVAKKSVEVKDMSVEYFKGCLDAAKDIDFSDDEYRSSSGSGRVIIRTKILEIIGEK